MFDRVFRVEIIKFWDGSNCDRGSDSNKFRFGTIYAEANFESYSFNGIEKNLSINIIGCKNGEIISKIKISDIFIGKKTSSY